MFLQWGPLSPFLPCVVLSHVPLLSISPVFLLLSHSLCGFTFLSLSLCLHLSIPLSLCGLFVFLLPPPLFFCHALTCPPCLSDIVSLSPFACSVYFFFFFHVTDQYSRDSYIHCYVLKTDEERQIERLSCHRSPGNASLAGHSSA